MGARRPLLGALAISLLGHIAFVILYPGTGYQGPIARFEVELVTPTLEAVDVFTEMPPAVLPDQSVENPQEPEQLAPSPDRVPVPAETVSADPEKETPAGPSAVLDLSQPPDWDALIKELPAAGPGIAFDPSLGEALDNRRRQRQRQSLVASRRAAAYGVADEDYARSGALGQELKMDGGCVTLVEDKSVEEGQRWWASQCTETRQNRFTLPAIDYDALGRAVVD